ncbi:hypothetical protein Tco_0711064 [Tanacetum coccineum]
MYTTQAQQKALDDALVALADHHKIKKCHMRLKTDIKPKEATFQVVLDALALTPFYQAFLITTEICPKIPGQEFEDLPLEQDILSFIKDIRHTGDITYLTDTQDSSKVAKSDKKKQPATMPKSKGLNVLFEVALTETEQMKLATKRSKTQSYSSRISSSGDGVDTQSKVPDKQQHNVTGTNKGASVIPMVPDVPKYNLESEEESWTFSQDDKDAEEESDMNDKKEEEKEEKADDEEVSSDQRVSTPPNYELTDEEENKEGDDKDKEGEQEQEEEDDLYRDLNTNLERSDAEMTDA